jgi:hypothetical protein
MYLWKHDFRHAQQGSTLLVLQSCTGVSRQSDLTGLPVQWCAVIACTASAQQPGRQGWDFWYNPLLVVPCSGLARCQVVCLDMFVQCSGMAMINNQIVPYMYLNNLPL